MLVPWNYFYNYKISLVTCHDDYVDVGIHRGVAPPIILILDWLQDRYSFDCAELIYLLLNLRPPTRPLTLYVANFQGCVLVINNSRCNYVGAL